MQTTPLNQVPITAQAYRTQPNNEAAQDGLYDYDDATDIVEDRESGSSEWSLSPVSESTSTSAFDSWLSAPPTPELKGHSAIGPVGKGTGGRSSLLLRRANRLGDRSYLGDAPEGGSWYRLSWRFELTWIRDTSSYHITSFCR